MTQAQPSTAPSLRLARTYDATPEQLFEAWTTPDIMAQFLGPAPAHCTDIHTDVRVGGTYGLVMVKSDGERLPVGGTYTIVDRPNKIAMTWKWEEDRPEDEVQTLLTLEFAARGEQTELILTHEGFASEESRENHEDGWSTIMDQLRTVRLA